MTQLCPFCRQEQVVVSNPLGLHTTALTKLACGHHIVSRDENEGRTGMMGMGMGAMAEQKKCAACHEDYTTWVVGAMSEFCADCRVALDINSQRDAAEALEDIKKGDITVTRGSVGVPGHALTAAHRKEVKIPDSKIVEMQRSMIDYGRLADDKTPLEKDTTYVIAKSGLYEIRRSDVANVIIKATTVVGMAEDVVEGVHLNIPKPPQEILATTVAFFRGVCEKAKSASEAYVQIWWNTQEKAYHMHVPQQQVSGGSVRHEGDFDKDCARTPAGEAIWLHVMDIHSHGSMSAFFSGTDDGDEKKAPEGRLFGVIGKVVQTLPEWKWRIRTREGFRDLNITDIFAFPDDNDAVKFQLSWASIFAAIKGGSPNGKVPLDCPVDPFSGATFPSEWLDVVQTWGGGSARGSDFRQQAHRNGGLSVVGNTLTPERMIIYIFDRKTNQNVEYECFGTELRPTGFKLTLKGEKHG